MMKFEEVHPFQQFSPLQAGKLLNIHPDSVKKLCASGAIEAMRITEKGMWRMSAQALSNYIETAKAAARVQ